MTTLFFSDTTFILLLSKFIKYLNNKLACHENGMVKK